MIHSHCHWGDHSHSHSLPHQYHPQTLISLLSQMLNSHLTATVFLVCETVCVFFEASPQVVVVEYYSVTESPSSPILFYSVLVSTICLLIPLVTMTVDCDDDVCVLISKSIRDPLIWVIPIADMVVGEYERYEHHPEDRHFPIECPVHNRCSVVFL